MSFLFFDDFLHDYSFEFNCIQFLIVLYGEMQLTSRFYSKKEYTYIPFTLKTSS